MDTRPRVGVTGNGSRWSPSWWCTSLALRLVGTVPERISVRHEATGKPLDAIIIGGGDDISPEHYGGNINEKVRLDPARDELEIALIKRALAQRIRMLGICRGAQLINVVLGGSLHEDIRELRNLTYNRPGLLPTKQVALVPGSRLAGIAGKVRLRVNSLHHQAIKRPGEAVRVVGHDLDRITQAVESTNERAIIGVQWHPEYLFYLPVQLRLFRWLSRGDSRRPE